MELDCRFSSGDLQSMANFQAIVQLQRMKDSDTRL